MNGTDTPKAMLNHIRLFFTLPQFAGDEIRTRQAQLLAIMLNSIIFGMPLLIISNLLGDNVPVAVNIINLVAIITALGLHYWLTKGELSRVAIATVLIVFSGITLSIIAIGTIRTPSTAIFLLAIVGAGFVFNQRTVITIIALSSLIVLALIIAENAGLLPEPDTSVTITQWITYTVLFALGGSLTYSATLTVRQALERANYELARRQQIETALQERETQLRVITDNIQEMVLLLDTQGVIRYANPSSRQQLGYEPASLIGQHSFNFIHPEDLLHIMPLLQAVNEHRQQPRLVEFRGQHAQGHFINLEATGQVFFDQNQAVGIVAVSRDVTARKLMETALRRQNSILENLHRVTLDILQRQSVDDLLQAVVLQAAELLDSPRGQIMLLEGAELVVCALTPNQRFAVGERTPRNEQLLSWQAVLTGQPIVQENYTAYLGQTQDHGSNALRAVAAFPILNGDRCYGVLAVGREQNSAPFDSEEVQAGQLLAQLVALALDNAQLYAAAQSELRERKQIEETLRHSNTTLQAHNEELDAFAHTVAHDLKGPIGIIFGFAELLLDTVDDFPVSDRLLALDHIFKNATKATSIIESLLVLAGVRKQDVQPEPIDTASIVDEALHRLFVIIQETSAVIIVSERETWPLVMGYGPWIEEVLVNYISNALKYAGQPPHIELTAKRLPDRLIQFNVCDNGVPLTATQKERLFAPFERLGQKQTTGHGLGLSIVRRIVEKLGGKLVSKTGKGRVIFFILSYHWPHR